jgi:hypothetical protein
MEDTNALVKSSQDAGKEWNAMSKAEKEEWSERARVSAIERRYIEDPEERKELMKMNSDFLTTYVKDYAEMFGMAVIFYAVPSKSGTGSDGFITHSTNATLSAAQLEGQLRFGDTMLRNVSRPVPLTGLDQKALDPLYRDAFHDLMRESKCRTKPFEALFIHKIDRLLHYQKNEV